MKHSAPAVWTHAGISKFRAVWEALNAAASRRSARHLSSFIGVTSTSRTSPVRNTVARFVQRLVNNKVSSTLQLPCASWAFWKQDVLRILLLECRRHCRPCCRREVIIIRA